MKSHRFDTISFVFGIVFLLFAVSAVWNPDFSLSLSVWVLPAAALILGIGLLASTLRSVGTDPGGDRTGESVDSRPEL